MLRDDILEKLFSKPIFKYSYDNTVSYATNCHINSEGKLSRTTNTSSKTIKHLELYKFPFGVEF